jgi:hypothetical protein
MCVGAINISCGAHCLTALMKAEAGWYLRYNWDTSMEYLASLCCRTSEWTSCMHFFMAALGWVSCQISDVQGRKKSISNFALREAIADAHSVPTHQSDLDLELWRLKYVFLREYDLWETINQPPYKWCHLYTLVSPSHAESFETSLDILVANSWHEIHHSHASQRTMAAL